jgi:hypothetical protein
MRKSVAAVFLMIAGSATAARAQVLDFQDLMHANGFPTTMASYSAAGYTISLDPGEGGNFASWGTTSPSFAGSTGLFRNQVGGALSILREAAGGAFDLFSVDLAHMLVGPRDPVNVTFTGFLAAGGSVTQTFMLGAKADGSPSFQTYTFSNSFRDLARVEWRQDAAYHQFDNISLGGGAVVPEPGTLLLLGSGLLGLYKVGRRRRQRIGPQ